MGCWNETCMVSNMPIVCGEEVVMLILQGNRLKECGFYYNSYWFLGAAMFGEYNDYGGIENIYDSDFAFGWLKNNLIPREEGNNKFYDYAVDPNNITVENLNKWFYGDRCQAKDVIGGVCPVQRAFVKKDIWDYLTNKEINGWAMTINKNVIKQRILDAFKVDEDYDDVDGIPKEKQELYKKMRANRKVESRLSEIRTTYNLWGMKIELFVKKNFDLITEMAMFVQHLDILRKSLHLTTGSGSQSTDYEELAEFSEFVADSCRKTLKEWEE